MGKKSLGIITFHDYLNYGTVLQAFALQRVTESMGYESELIDFKPAPKRSMRRVVKHRITHPLQMANKLKHRRKALAAAGGIEARKQSFASFRSRYLKVGSRRYQSDAEIQADPPGYDGYLVGSDQTWNPYVAGNPDAFYLAFAPQAAWKGSYAPSIAVSSLDKSQTERLKRLTGVIEFLSCREESGSELLRGITGRKVQTVLDPTLLLTRDEWSAVSANCKVSEPYILQYLLGDIKVHRDYVRRISEMTGWKIIDLPYSYSDLGETCRDSRYVGPDGFLALVAGAALVCTDSFHGTAFAVNFGRPFLAFSKHESGRKRSENSRLLDLLKMFGLEDHHIEDFEAMPEEEDWAFDEGQTNALIAKAREKSLAFLSSTLFQKGDAPQPSPVTVDDLYQGRCFGCALCEYVCPKGAVKVGEAPSGELRAAVDKDLCVCCGACVESCPAMTAPRDPVRDIVPVSSCLAYCKDESVREKSSSGGMFRALSDATLDKGGVVCGCVYDSGVEPVHIVSGAKDDIISMMGSKYVQSDMSGCFRTMEKMLKEGRSVLFSGVPCQTHAVRRAFGKEPQLLIAAVVCHGSMNRELWRTYLSIVSKGHGGVSSCTMRDKSRGWSNYGLRLVYADGVEEVSYRQEDGYLLKCFTDGYLQRDRCLSCPFKGSRIDADILLGDGWAAESMVDGFGGGEAVSQVYCLTEKGRAAFDGVFQAICQIPVDASIMVRANPRIMSPAKAPYGYEDFGQRYHSEPGSLDAILKRYAQPSLMNKCVRKLLGK